MIPAIGRYNWRSKILENIGVAFLLKYEIASQQLHFTSLDRSSYHY
jgi:hypothetical protein